MYKPRYFDNSAETHRLVCTGAFSHRRKPYYFRLDHNRMATFFFFELSFLKLGSEVTQKHLALFLIGELLLHQLLRIFVIPKPSKVH